MDSRNLITIPVETSFEIRKEEQFGKYVSFFPLEKEVASITLEGFAYPLDHHYLPNTSGGLCVSNEIVRGRHSSDGTVKRLKSIEIKEPVCYNL